MGAGNAGILLRARSTAGALSDAAPARLQSGIVAILRSTDWIPVRLAGVVWHVRTGAWRKRCRHQFYLLAGGSPHTSRYQVLTRLAQFSLARTNAY